MNVMLDWNKLVADGRAKAIGTPWSDEEQAILSACEIKEERVKKVEELRSGKGNTTVENTGKKEKTLSKMNQTELIAKCKELGIAYDKDGVTNKKLRNLINNSVSTETNKQTDTTDADTVGNTDTTDVERGDATETTQDDSSDTTTNPVEGTSTPTVENTTENK